MELLPYDKVSLLAVGYQSATEWGQIGDLQCKWSEIFHLLSIYIDKNLHREI